MNVRHITLEAGVATKVTLPVKSGEVLVKNFTEGDLLVSIEKEDFTENYVKIPAQMAEVINECELKSSSSAYFFDDLYLKSIAGGEVEIRCLKS